MTSDTTTPDIDKTLAERGARYSDFRLNANVAVDIKSAMRRAPGWDAAPPYVQEGFDMIASKISRALTGDVLYDDNFHDIIGYAKLLQDRAAQDRAAPANIVGNDSRVRDPAFLSDPLRASLTEGK